MTRHALRLQVLTALAFFNAGVSHVFADTCREDLLSARLGMIDLTEPAVTEPISSREALDQLGTVGELSTSLMFQREVPEFWRIKVRRRVNPRDLIVRYRVLGGDDRAGLATHRDAETQGFPVRLIPSQPRVICENRTHRIISGGFTAMAVASGIGLAGLYSLEINVDVEPR